MTPPRDEEVRERIRRELDRSFLVEASAGTGKTTCLVERLGEALLAGAAAVDEVAAITFTRRAAGELRLRLRDALESALAREVEPGRLGRARAALEGLDRATIGTIHGFAATLLRERPVEAGQDPELVVDEPDEARLRRHFEDWLELRFEQGDEALRRYFVVHGDEEALFEAARELWAHRDLRVPPARSRPGFDRVERTRALLARAADLAAAIRAACLDGSGTARRLEGLLLLGAAALEPEVRDDLDRGEAELLAARWAVVGRARPRVVPADWSCAPERAAALLADAFRLRVELGGYRLTATRDAAESVLLALEAFPHERRGTGESLVERRRLAGLVDHLGLLVHARDLVRDHLEVRRELQARVRRLFVDELQDTDPLQLELIAFLAAPGYDGRDWREALARAEPGRLFAVGDPKQSIYRFRRADVGLYREVQELLRAAGGEVVTLTTCFRARPGVVRLVNEAFAPLFTPDRTQVPYAPIEAHRPASGAPEVLALPVRCEPKVHAVREREPLELAAWLARALDLGGGAPLGPDVLQVADGTGTRPARPSDVALLFRRLVSEGRDLTEPYARALQACGIPVVVFSGSAFRGRDETAAVTTVLRAIERPDDRALVWAALRGPLFSHDDAALLGPDARPALDPLSPARAADPEVAASLELLGRLHRERNARPVARTLQELYDATRALTVQAESPHGPRRVANLLKLQRLARTFDARGGDALSFRAFVAELQGLEREPDSPLAEEGRGGVRVLSMHQAKGLEFPVVYVADPTTTCRPHHPPRRVLARRDGHVLVPVRVGAPQDLPLLAPRWAAAVAHEVQHETAEAERLLYVATTRARDVLVLPRVPGWGPHPVWDRLAHRLHPALDALLADGGVRSLDLPEPGVAPAPPRARDAVAGVGDLHAAWRDERRVALERAARPSLPVVAVTTLARAATGVDGPALEDAPERPDLPDAPGSSVSFPAPPEPRSFGTFVHAVLAVVPLDADAATVARWVDHLAREGPGAWGPDHRALAADLVRVALAHDLLARARASGHVFRELPLWALRDGVLVEGVIDLAFREEGGLVIVDHKTGPSSDDHAAQVRLYAELIGEPVKETWLLYLGERRAVRVT